MGYFKNHMMEVDDHVNELIDDKTNQEIINSVNKKYGNYWVSYVVERLLDLDKEEVENI
tara:strand:+ start:304 stop:480 length:177 start_codon:yes stop_codon:yes gene_type:complete